MSYRKFISIEREFTKKEIEDILRDHIEKELNSMDVDFRKARWIQDDYTYSLEEGSPKISVVVLIDDCKLRSK